MPITEIQCPRCGATAKLGLPRDATIKSVTAADRSRPSCPDLRLSRLTCSNDHEFHVLFER